MLYKSYHKDKSRITFFARLWIHNWHLLSDVLCRWGSFSVHYYTCREKPHTLLLKTQWILNWNLSRLLCMKVDFICTLNKLLEEKHLHFNTYCWVLKHVFLYIKKTFRKQNTNRVICSEALLALGTFSLKLMDATWQGHRGSQDLRTHILPPFSKHQLRNPSWGTGQWWLQLDAVVTKSWEIWQQRQLHTSQPLLLSWWTLNTPNVPGALGEGKKLKGPYFSLNP